MEIREYYTVINRVKELYNKQLTKSKKIFFIILNKTLRDKKIKKSDFKDCYDLIVDKILDSITFNKICNKLSINPFKMAQLVAIQKSTYREEFILNKNLMEPRIKMLNHWLQNNGIIFV